LTEILSEITKFGNRYFISNKFHSKLCKLQQILESIPQISYPKPQTFKQILSLTPNLIRRIIKLKQNSKKKKKKKKKRERKKKKKNWGRLKKTNVSFMANVRAESDCLAAGGGSWGKGSISKRSTKAPKSFLCVLFRRVLRRVSTRTAIPATPTPIINQNLGLEACSLISFSDWDMIKQRNGVFKGDYNSGFWVGFSLEGFWA